MSFEEKKVALIPRLVVRGRMGENEYALLVTDKRSILVHERGSKAGLAGAMGGVVAATIANAVATRKTFDYEKENVEDLVRNPKNIAIPHEALEMVKMKKMLIGPLYRMEVKYQAPDKRKTIKGALQPPSEHVKQKKGEGIGKKQAYFDYAKKVQDVYRQVLSPPRFETVMSSKL